MWNNCPVLTMRNAENQGLRDLVKEWLNGKSDLVGIEIGSYAGESAEMFLESKAFLKLYCIDPWKEHYDPKDAAGENGGIHMAEEFFNKRFEGNHVIIKVKFMSSEVVDMFGDESIDFVYIDGNHTYNAVKEDIKNYLPKVKKGGIISGHDYGFIGTPDVKKAVDESFNKPPMKIYSDHSWLYIKE